MRLQRIRSGVTACCRFVTTTSPPISSSTPSMTRDEFLDEIARVFALQTHHNKNSLLIASLYEQLSSQCRQAHVRPHKTLLNALRNKLKSSPLAQQQFLLSDDGLSLRCLRPTANQRMNLDDDMNLDYNDPNPTSTARNVAPLSSSNAVSVARGSPPRMIANPLLFSFPSSRVGVSTANTRKAFTVVSPNDFYFGVDLSALQIPAAALSTAPPKESCHKSPSEHGGAAVDIAQFTSFIPTYFVPIAELVKVLPEGYTEQHIDLYLSSAKTIQMVTVFGERFIRIFGGYGQVDLDGCAEAKKYFPQFSPDPSLIDPFVKAFDGIMNRWMPLTTLLARAPAEAVEALPFKEGQALLYFAQMQHVFDFSPDNGGAVLLRSPKYSGLTPETTPTPLALSKALHIVAADVIVSIEDVDRYLREHNVLETELLLFFPSVEYFLRSHGQVFFVMDDDQSLKVCRTRYKERMDRKKLPLHEQLELAHARGDKKEIRTIRRKIALLHSADNPLHDRAHLAKEIHKALPRKGHIPIKFFMRNRLPDDILNFMPKSYYKFFVGFPDLFQIFELHRAGHWCIMRTGLQPPPGVLRKEYSEDDSVRVLAQILSRLGPRSVSFLHLHLPEGVLKTVRSRHTDLLDFILAFSQYFSVVMPMSSGNSRSAAVVHLTQLPVDMLVGETEGGDDGEHSMDSVMDEEDPMPLGQQDGVAHIDAAK